MKKLIFIIIILFLGNMAIAQWKVMPAVDFSHSTSFLGIYNTSSAGLPAYWYNQPFHLTGTFYQKMNFSGGINLIHNNYSLGIKLNYQYFIGRGQLLYQDKGVNKGLMKSHLLGFVITNRFREKKIVRPYFSIALSSEIKTNYKNKYLRELEYDPISFSFVAFNIWNTELNIYKSTPFIGDLLVGCNFRIYNELSINLAFGYSVRVIKAQYARVTFPAGPPSTPIYEEKIGRPYSLVLNYMTIQLGLSYAFDTHKRKPKTETP